MPVEQYANAFATVLTAPMLIGDLTASVAVPAPVALQGGQFRIAIDAELLLVTAGAASTTWTVTRGVEGTSAAAHGIGKAVVHVLTAASLSAAAATLGPVTRGTVNSFLAAESLGPKAALRRWYAALGARATTPVDILCVGDSVSAGNGATTRANRWIEKLAVQLRALYQPAGVTGGIGYIPTVDSAALLFANPFVVTGTTTNGSFGLGNRSRVLGTGGDQLVLTFTGTGVDIFWVGLGAAGTFGWKIDAGGVNNIDCNIGYVDDGHRTTAIRGLSATSHTLTLSRISGTPFIEGVMVYNGDEAAGIRVWDCGNGGIGSNQTGIGAPGSPGPRQVTHLIQPSLVLVEVGTNDWAFGGQTVAQYATNLATILSTVRADTTIPPSFVFLTMYQRNQSGTPVDTWANYVNAATAVALADGGVAVMNFTERFGGYVAPSSGNNADGMLYSDLVHPSDIGHQAWADAITNFLRP